MNKKTQHVIIAAAIGCYFVFLIGMIWYFNRDTGETATETDGTSISEETEVTYETLIQTETTASATDSSTVSEIAAENSGKANSSDSESSQKMVELLEGGVPIRLDNNILEFPRDYTEILSEKDGWKVTENRESAVAFEKDGQNCTVVLYAPVKSTCDINILKSAGCSGIGVSLQETSGEAMETAPTFVVFWITWGNSLDDVELVLGEPNQITEIRNEAGEVTYTSLFYEAEYDSRTYKCEFGIETDVGVVSMNFYYIEKS